MDSRDVHYLKGLRKLQPAFELFPFTINRFISIRVLFLLLSIHLNGLVFFAIATIKFKQSIRLSLSLFLYVYMILHLAAKFNKFR